MPWVLIFIFEGLGDTAITRYCAVTKDKYKDEAVAAATQVMNYLVKFDGIDRSMKVFEVTDSQYFKFLMDFETTDVL